MFYFRFRKDNSTSSSTHSSSLLASPPSTTSLNIEPQNHQNNFENVPNFARFITRLNSNPASSYNCTSCSYVCSYPARPKNGANLETRGVNSLVTCSCDDQPLEGDFCSICDQYSDVTASNDLNALV